MDAGINYICTVVRGEVLSQFDLLSADVENTKILNLDYYIKGLALHFPLVSLLSKHKRAMRRGMKNAQPKTKTLCGALDWSA